MFCLVIDKNNINNFQSVNDIKEAIKESMKQEQTTKTAKR